MSWKIQPLSQKTRLICQFTRKVDDDLRISNKVAKDIEVGRMLKKLTGKVVKNQEKFGLLPFCASNPPPEVTCQMTLLFINFILIVELVLLAYLAFFELCIANC